MQSAMSRLSKLIDEGMSSDAIKFPSPHYVLDQGATDPGAKPEPRPAQPGDSLFRLRRMSPIPAEFYQEINRAEEGAKELHGVFPEILRAYAVVGSKLFLWKYDGELNDLYVWDSENLEEINAIELFIPKVNVFNSEVAYVLAVSTRSKLTFLELSFPDDLVEQQVTVQESRFFLNLGNVHITCFTSTPEGQLFAGAADGDLYEIQYSKSWFRPTKCARVGTESHVAMRYIVSLIALGSIAKAMYQWLSSGPNAIIDLIFLSRDDKRFIIALSQQSDVLLFEFVHNSLEFKSKIVNVIELIGREEVKWLYGTSERVIRNAEKIIKIHPLESWQSNVDLFVAIASSGARFYFTLKSDDLVLRAVDVFLPCKYSDAREAFAASDEVYENILKFYNQGGVTFFYNALAISGRHSHELICSVDQNARRPACTTNQKFTFTVPVLDIKEDFFAFSSSDLFGLMDLKNGSKSRLISLKNTAFQHASCRRSFVLIMDSEVCELVMECPIDHFINFLLDKSAEAKIDGFLSGYPADEACAMCLILICSAQELPHHIQNQVDDVIENVRVNYQHGLDSYSSGASYARYRSQWLALRGAHWFWKTAIRKENVKSGDNRRNLLKCEDGVASGIVKFLCRILRSIWNISLADIDIELRRNFAEAQPKVLSVMKRIYAILVQLSKFFETEDMQYYIRQLVLREERVTDETLASYVQNIRDVKLMIDFILRCQILLNIFIALTKQPDPHRILGEFSLDATKRSFGELVLNADAGAELFLHSLIKSIMRENPSDLDWLDQIRRQSPDLISDEDIDYFDALNLLSASSRSSKDEEYMASKTKAVQMLKRAAPKRSFNLVEACKKLLEFHMYDELTQIILYRADLLQKKQVDGVNSDHDRERLLSECFIQFTQALAPFLQSSSAHLHSQEIRDSIIRRVEKSDCEYMHMRLYDWLVSKSLINVLWLFRNPFVEKFLSECEMIELLIMYYEKHERYEDGARFCLKNASDSNNQLSLEERYELLKKGVALAKFLSEWSSTSPNHILRSPSLTLYSPAKVSQSTSSADLIFQLRNLLKIADCQRSLVMKLESLKVPDSEIREIKLSLVLNPAKLFQIASSYKFWDQLIVLKYNFRDYSSSYDIEKIWDLLISEAPGIEAVKDQILSLSKRTTSSEFVFPLSFLIFRLAAISQQRISFIEPTLPLFCMLNSNVPLARIGQALIDILKKERPAAIDLGKILLITGLQLLQRLIRETRAAFNIRRLCDELVQETERWNLAFQRADSEFFRDVQEKLSILGRARDLA